MAQVYKSAGIESARIAGKSSVMDDVAGRIASRARSLAAGHRVTGELIAGMGVEETRGKHGVTDRLVVMKHESAAAIEFGHLTRPGKDATQHWVPGLHIMLRAMSDV